MTERMTAASFRQLESEASFQTALVDHARTIGWRVMHVRKAQQSDRHLTPMAYDGKGWPDLVLVRDGRLVFAELKAQRGRLTDDQQAWIAALEAAGQEVYVWRPSDWADAVAILTRRNP